MAVSKCGPVFHTPKRAIRPEENHYGPAVGLSPVKPNE
jgi:hypothetical protein